MAFNAKTGQKLWEKPTGTGVIAAPSTYLVDGKQYVSVAVGWGGNYGLYTRSTNFDSLNAGTVFTFALGGTAPQPEFAQWGWHSLLAGMVHGLLSGHSPEQTLRTATAIAAMAVTQIGFGISDAAHLATLESGVRVRPLTEE